MSTFLDIDSTYRDRTLYPNPCDFQVSQKFIQCCSSDNYNPISSASIYYPLYAMYAYPITVLEPNQLLIDRVTYRVSGFYYLPEDIPRNQNIYNDNILELFSDEGNFDVGTFYTILDTVYSPTNYTLENGVVYQDVDDGSRFIPDPYANVYLSLDSSNIDGYYVGKHISTNGNTAIITTYYGDTRLAQLDRLLIAPVLMGSAFTIYTTETWTLILNTDLVVNGSLAYPSNNRGTIGSDRNLYRIRNKTEPFFQGFIASATNNTFVFGANASSVDDIYANKWIVITRSSTIVNERVSIKTYDGSSKTAVAASPFSSAPSPNDSFDILSIDGDGYFPLSNHLLNPYKCYTIGIHSISIPNVPIFNGYGSIMSFYPFIYVEFSSLENTTENSLITNVPNISKVLFKIPTFNIHNPIISDFVVLLCPMEAVTKLNSTDKFRLRLFLPNSDILQFTQTDTILPSPPNPILQVSYTITIT